MIWLDGERGTALPLPDRGLEFGDGLFETLLVRKAEPLFQSCHLDRLQRGCRTLGLVLCDSTVTQQLQLASEEIKARDWPWAALRITLTRGAGPRGYAPPENPVIRVLMSATSLGETPASMSAPASLGLASVRWPQQPLLAGLKHLNRLEQVLAAREYRDAATDEAVMLDQRGTVVSVVAGNLFLAVGGRLITPRLDQCGIAGTRRELIIRRWAPALGLEVKEQSVSIAQLEGADEVFYSNSLIGLRPVARFGQGSWASHTICEALFRQYQGEPG